MDQLIAVLTAHGFTLESAVTLGALFAVWWNLSGRLGKLTQACNNFYANTKTFLGLVAHKTGLKGDFHALFESGFMPCNVAFNSPMRLSRRGERVARRLDASRTVERELPKILKKVGRYATPYEVQKVCFNHAMGTFFEKLGGETRRKVHEEAYRDGGDIQNVLAVYGIMFRDAVFDKRGIDVGN